MRRDDRGSAAVIVVGLAGVLVLVALAGATVGGLLVGQRRAAAAADLAALAAAEALASPAGSSRPSRDPCAAAAAVTEANHAALDGCVAEGREVTVSVTVRVRGPAGTSWHVPGSARAGPSGSGGPDR